MELTNEERELLIAAETHGGQLALYTASLAPAGIVGTTGRLKFNDDPARAARYRDALESLVQRGYLRYVSGILYALTGAGYTKARELKPA